MPTPRHKKRILLVAAISAIAWTADAGYAQSRSGSGNPLDQIPKVQPPEAPTVTIGLPSTPPPDAQAARMVTPTSFQVEGSHAVPFTDVVAVFTPLAGKTISVEQLINAAKQVTAIYQRAGYALAFCFIPEQDFSQGMVHVVVVEGYVHDVHIDGDAGGSEAAIRRVADDVTSERPLRTTTFNRMVALLARLPGVKIDANIPVPATTDGAATMTLKVTRHAFTFTSGVDTFQPGERLLGTVTANGLTPFGDQLSVTAMLSHDADNERYVAVSESVPVSKDGLLLHMDAYHFSSDTPIVVSSTAQGSDRQADSRVSLSASQPLILEVDHQLTLMGGLALAHNTDHYTGAALESLDDEVENLRIAHVGVSSSSALTTPVAQQVTASADLYRGIDGLGASVSNPTVDVGFTRLVLALTDRLSWTDTLATNFSFRGQYSHNKLPSSEQIAFGGGQFGLGYPVSDEVGDRGYGVSIDLGRSFAFDSAYLKTLEPYVAIDAARAYSNLLSLVPARMESFAIGTRLSDAHHYSLDLSLAKPIGAMPIDGDRRSLRVNLNYSYRSD